ncbi:MAG: ABC transporter ATP-binding protein [Anaerolineaceae bacterium]|nr:ABC transporter ATP-binding protein [Anaerolineaceae bacterium]
MVGGFGGGPGGRGLLDREVSKPKQAGATLERLAKYFGAYGVALILVVALIIGSTYTQVKTPELAGQAVDCFLTPAIAARVEGSSGSASPFAQFMGKSGSNIETNCRYHPLPATATTNDYISGLGNLILLIVGLSVAGAIMSGLMFFIMTWSAQHVLRKLRMEVFRHLHQLSLGYYAEHEAGSVMSRITNDMETINQAVSFALVSVASGSLLLVWVAVKMLSLSLAYGLVSMAVVPLMIVATFWISGQARKAFRRTRIEIGKVNANLEENIAGVREVQAFGREDANIEAFRESNAANRDANITAVSFTAALAPTLEALGYVAVAIVTITGGFFLLRGQTLFGTAISLGLIVTFIGYVQRFNQPIQQISVLWANMQSAVAGAERIFELLDTVPDVQDAPGAVPLLPIQGRVEFEHVSAAYVKDEMVLKDVSFVAEPGQTVAVVGQTGAGKTTIINLIPRFYDVLLGKILIDGQDIARVTRASLRKQIGLVLQDTFLFSDSVMNNIRFGRPEATDDEVKAAAKLSHADDFINRLPQGYDTVLGEHGSGLSQGQRQLIAIARAALADPRILILDEATSSVDTRTERQIQQALDILLKGRTSFVIAHRLSTIRNANQVLVIENGEIVERGTHQSLLAQKGAYYNLYMRQFRRDENGTPEPNGNGGALNLHPRPVD